MPGEVEDDVLGAALVAYGLASPAAAVSAPQPTDQAAIMARSTTHRTRLETMRDTTQDVLRSSEAGGRVIRGSAARVIANVAGIVLGLATATLLLRHLGVEDSGRYVTVLSLVGIAVSVVDTGLNVTASSELALREPGSRRALVANILAQRLLIAPVALLLLVVFALIAGYPSEMVAGTALAGTGVLIVAVADAVLVPLTVQLRNAGLAFVDFLRQVVTLAGVALPLLTAAARDDLARLRYAIEGLSEGAVIAGVLVVLVTVRAAEPVMAVIGGEAFRPSGAVLQIQVAALLFIALYQIWTVSLIALGRQRELILTNALGLLGVAIFAAALVPPLGAKGGAAASVLGDAVLAGLIYWRLHQSTGRVTVSLGFLARVAAAAAAAVVALVLTGIPDLVAATLAGVLFLGVGWLIGMVPKELREALGPEGLFGSGK
jgi:O-antigen/teichoic acid export membrane protein